MDSSGRIGAKMSDIEGEALASARLKGAMQGEIVYETIERTKPRLRMITIPIMENRK